HAVPVKVAKYSPTGFYIASADLYGKIRIWDTTSKEHILKYEYQPFAGPVKDLAWSEDSKRIIVGGTGREKFGTVFMWDTGSSVGEIMGMSRTINSVDLRITRPYRAVTGSEDSVVCFFAGPPFRFKLSSTVSKNYVFISKKHSNFVNCVRFSPTGAVFISGGADGRIFVYDGDSGECLYEVEPAHKGGVYGIAFSPDGKYFISASADRFVKAWNLDGTVVSLMSEFKLSDNINDMIVSSYSI
ncbi:unnamed protein product, partial [Protopolystoma xenopodis]